MVNDTRVSALEAIVNTLTTGLLNVSEGTSEVVAKLLLIHLLPQEAHDEHK